MSEPTQPPGAPPPGPPGAPFAGPPGPPGSGAAQPDGRWAVGQRYRTHPLTPLVESIRSLGLLVAAMLVFGQGAVRDAASALGGLPGLLLLLAGIAVLLVLAVGVNYLAWQRREYFFDQSGDFRLDSGILQRNERRVTLSRLQSVDVVRPLLGRVVGLAQVRIEVAGAGDSRVVLSYLTEAQAQALRAEIIARAAGVAPGAGEAPESVLVTVPTGDLVVSLLLRSETISLLLLSVVVVASIVVTEGAAGLTVLLFTGGIPLVSVFTQFTRFFGFTVAESPDGLRLRHGLASVQSQTVPPGRVQAIEVSEPLLWRRRGWVRVSLNVAGLQSGQEEGSASQVLLPVAPRDVAAGIIGRVLPGVDLSGLRLQPAPARARKRAWLQFPNLAVAVDERVLAVRRGFLTRHLAVIPHARTQSVTVTQGPCSSVHIVLKAGSPVQPRPSGASPGAEGVSTASKSSMAAPKAARAAAKAARPSASFAAGSARAQSILSPALGVDHQGHAHVRAEHGFGWDARKRGELGTVRDEGQPARVRRQPVGI